MLSSIYLCNTYDLNKHKNITAIRNSPYLDLRMNWSSSLYNLWKIKVCLFSKHFYSSYPQTIKNPTFLVWVNFKWSLSMYLKQIRHEPSNLLAIISVKETVKEWNIISFKMVSMKIFGTFYIGLLPSSHWILGMTYFSRKLFFFFPSHDLLHHLLLKSNWLLFSEIWGGLWTLKHWASSHPLNLPPATVSEV